MATYFNSIPLSYWYVPGFTEEMQSKYEANRIKRLARERLIIKRIHGKPISVRLYRKLMRVNPSYYYELPSEWRSNAECLRYYVKRALGIRMSRREGTYGHLLAFMRDGQIGFSGSTCVILREHGEQIYANHAKLLVDILMCDCAKQGADISSLEAFGRWHIKWSKEQAKPMEITPGVSLSGFKMREDYVAQQARLTYLFRYYPLSAFEASVESPQDWQHFLSFYGEEGVSAFASGRRYLLERDMGL